MCKLRSGLVAMCAAIATTIVVPADAATPVETYGSALQSACAQTSADGYEPATGRFDCQGTLAFRGTWTGLASFRTRGTVGLISGDASGTVEAHFDGVSASIDHKGHLDFNGTVSIVGSTGSTVVRLTIVGGSGAFLGATGTVTATGTTLITGGPALLNYYGTWTHPAY